MFLSPQHVMYETHVPAERRFCLLHRSFAHAICVVSAAATEAAAAASMLRGDCILNLAKSSEP